MSAQADTSLRVSRRIQADPETVFRAWTDPERLKEWHAPEGLIVGTAEVDAREGGRYRIRMDTPDGTGHTAVGTYRVVDPPRKLVFTWDWAEEGAGIGDTLVTVELKPVDGGKATEVVLTHEMLPDADSATHHEQGWTSIVERLAKRFA